LKEKQLPIQDNQQFIIYNNIQTKTSIADEIQEESLPAL
jgi:hypothetical protein